MNLKGIRLTWLGHATFRIETPPGRTILVDPWVMGNPMCPEKEKDVKKVDVLLCTHGHFRSRSPDADWKAERFAKAGTGRGNAGNETGSDCFLVVIDNCYLE